MQRIALRTRWLWQNWMDPRKPCQGLPLPIDNGIKTLFDASTQIQIRNGQSASFWESRWLQGMVLKESMPNLYHSTRRKMSLPALTDQNWVRNLKHNPPGIDVHMRIRPTQSNEAHMRPKIRINTAKPTQVVTSTSAAAAAGNRQMPTQPAERQPTNSTTKTRATAAPLCR